MKSEKEEQWKVIRIYGRTYEGMNRFCNKGKTYADIVDDLFRYRYAAEMKKLDDDN